MIHHPDIPTPRARYLQPWSVIAFLAVFLAAFVPLSAWFGWNNPALFDLRGHHYPEPWAEATTVLTTLALFLVPLAWIAVGRAVDLLALQFLLNGLIVLGYFFLATTAKVIAGAEQSILTGGEQAVAINAVGFFTLLAVLVTAYVLFSRRGVRLAPLPQSPEALDRRLRWFLVPILLVVAGMIALPMLLTRTVPMLSADPMVGRGILEKSSLGRPFYNLGSSLLPALAASSLVLALRRRNGFAKIFCPEAVIVGAVLVIQFLTSNRLPLAITMLLFFALLSMERRLPRALLVLGVAGFLAFFLLVSGFSSIIRQNRAALASDNLVATAFAEAFVGNNLADLRDAAWVLSKWDYEPLDGRTYLGGIAAFLPSAVFPQKKDWYLGLVALRIVGWPTEEHFGLRVSFFAESFLNFGLAGVVGLGVVFGVLAAYLLKKLHLSVAEPVPCLARNLGILLGMQLALALAESSQGFVFYSIAVLLILMRVAVYRPAPRPRGARTPLPA